MFKVRTFIRHLNTREGPKSQRVAGMMFEAGPVPDMGSTGKSAHQKAEGGCRMAT